MRSNKTNSIPKQLEHKLAELDDTLSFVAGSLESILGGDAGHLRRLAGELRNLICESSQLEGLLWRLMQDVVHGAHDAVDLHKIGNVDRTNPLSQELSVCFAPLFMPGHGSPQRQVLQYSLRKLIKSHEAVYINGCGITHEQLISRFANQMGVPHAAEDIGVNLAALNAIKIGGKSPLEKVLFFDGVLTLIVGERLLTTAAEQLGYIRHRASNQARIDSILQKAPVVTTPLIVPGIPQNNNRDEGAMVFQFVIPKGFQAGDLASFDAFRSGSQSVVVRLERDGSLSFQATNLFCDFYSFSGLKPDLAGGYVNFVLSWNIPDITIGVNGAELIKTVLRERKQS
ncbi:hypothetical protein [Dechloromonas denitrificans]|uniref:hypothetical protein n=1 Tax=Dechloromonas denitrificans TaxID=281362 RepID=UPI001CFAA9CF|nr:hypothetical protein [Dechloromonas denitrificans]UCV07754.1 hypothetical protein KI615_20640 [Dechloromonas denitrificans]